MSLTFPPARPRFEWENIKPADDLGEAGGVLTESAVRAHCFAIGDDPEPYLADVPGRGPIAPPSLLVNDLLKLFLLGYDSSSSSTGGLHTRAIIHLRSPIGIGEAAVLKGSHTSKYVRRGRRYRVCESTATRRDGSVISRMTAIETVGYQVAEETDTGGPPESWATSLPYVDGKTPADAPVAAPGVQPLVEGTVLPSVRRTVSMEQSVVFSGFPFSWAQPPQAVREGLHTDPGYARAAGYDQPVLQGLLSCGHLLAVLHRQFGDRIYYGTDLSLSFVSPILVNTTLTSQARSVGRVQTEAGSVQQLAVWTRNENGDLATVGYARVPAE